MDVQSFFLRYLLLPIIFAVSTVVLTIVNKKNQFINNKMLIVSLLVLAIVLALPGFLGFLSLHFMPWGYIISQIYFLFAGTAFVYLMSVKFPDELLHRKLFLCCGIVVSSLLGIYLFTLSYDWLSTVPFSLWAASSIVCFIIPLLFWWTYVALLSIPNEIYKIWAYPSQPLVLEMEHLDFNRMLVLELELYKNTADREPLKVKAKAPANMNFGSWFYKFIEDYNLKFPKSTVGYINDTGTAYKWIFFVKTSPLKKNLFIDPDLDISKNGITEKMTIHARRVSENDEEPERIYI